MKVNKYKYNAPVCGLCGKKLRNDNDIYKDEGVDTGFLCASCYYDTHIEYFIEDF